MSTQSSIKRDSFGNPVAEATGFTFADFLKMLVQIGLACAVIALLQITLKNLDNFSSDSRGFIVKLLSQGVILAAYCLFNLMILKVHDAYYADRSLAKSGIASVALSGITTFSPDYFGVLTGPDVANFQMIGFFFFGFGAFQLIMTAIAYLWEPKN